VDRIYLGGAATIHEVMLSNTKRIEVVDVINKSHANDFTNAGSLIK